MIPGIRRHPKTRLPIAGYSLLEILVSLTIVSVLLAFFIPVMRKAQERSRQIRCMSNMRQIGLAFRCYQNEHKGYYPRVNDSATQNWETYLADPTVGGVYLTGNLIGTDGWGNSKFKTSFICPSMVKRPDFTANGEYWGYSINYCRVGISYNPAGWPWQLATWPDLDLDMLYTKQGENAVLVDGNFIQFGGNDWDVFTTGAWFDWGVIPIHDETVNVLFLDGHVSSFKTASAADRERLNRAWHGGVPSTLGNPW